MKRVVTVLFIFASASAVFAFDTKSDTIPTSLRKRSVAEYVKTLGVPESLDVRSVMIEMTEDDCHEVMQSVPVEVIAPRTRLVFDKLGLVALPTKKSQSFVIKHMLLYTPREVEARIALLQKYVFPSKTRDSFIRMGVALPAYVTARRLRCIEWTMGFLFDFDDEQRQSWNLRRRLEHLAFGLESLGSVSTNSQSEHMPETAALQNLPLEPIEDERPALSDWERARVLRLLSLSKHDLDKVLECVPELFLELEGKEEGALSMSMALRNIASKMKKRGEKEEDIYMNYAMAVHVLPSWLIVNPKAAKYVEKFLALKDLLFPPLWTQEWPQRLDLFLSLPYHQIDERME